jgi:hypothetical protein
MMKTVSGSILALAVLGSSALAQQPSVIPEHVQQGKRLALRICANCHVVAPDSRQPILEPPAPSFESIAQRSTTTADYVRTFLTTTHRDLSNLPNEDSRADERGTPSAFEEWYFGRANDERLREQRFHACSSRSRW